MTTREIVKQAKRHLLTADPILGKIICSVNLAEWSPKGDYFVKLVESIVSQQLSTKAADTIWKRFVGLFPKGEVTAEYLLNISDQKIRNAGISWSKVAYIKNFAKKLLEKEISFEQLHTMTDEEIIAELTKIKGIGRWTAEMFLMFAIGRLDVFSYGDLGLRRAIKNLYGFKHFPTNSQIEDIIVKWRPYRTIGCLYLWKSLEM
jgi:DNA-3-methyladenine glycosylase II